MGHGNLKAIVAGSFALLAFLAVVGIGEWQAETIPQETMEGIAIGLFDTYVVAFLVLAVLLTGALLGALYLGDPGRDSTEEEDA